MNQPLHLGQGELQCFFPKFIKSGGWSQEKNLKLLGNEKYLR